MEEIKKKENNLEKDHEKAGDFKDFSKVEKVILEEKRLMQMDFFSFLKLMVAIGFSFGCVMGILGFFISLMGIGNVNSNFGSVVFTGVTAGVINIFLFPVMYVIFGAFFSLLLFLPFKYFLKIIDGIKIKVKLK